MNDKNDDARLERWWTELTPEQRKAAVNATETGTLPEELQTSLKKTGYPATKSGSSKLDPEVDRFLKMRHDA